MKKTFKLEGLECANCAAKIENSVKKLAGVDSVSVNFMTTKMVIEAEESAFSGIIESATAIVKKLEPHVVVRKA